MALLDMDSDERLIIESYVDDLMKNAITCDEIVPEEKTVGQKFAAYRKTWKRRPENDPKKLFT